MHSRLRHLSWNCLMKTASSMCAKSDWRMHEKNVRMTSWATLNARPPAIPDLMPHAAISGQKWLLFESLRVKDTDNSEPYTGYAAKKRPIMKRGTAVQSPI